MKKQLITLGSIAAVILPAVTKAAVSIDFELVNSTGLGSADAKETVINIIKFVMGFLGIIAVCIVLLGGFKWMTAQGSEDKVKAAKKLIGAGVTGLVIILAAFVIVNFVITTFSSVTNQ